MQKTMAKLTFIGILIKFMVFLLIKSFARVGCFLIIESSYVPLINKKILAMDLGF